MLKIDSLRTAVRAAAILKGLGFAVVLGLASAPAAGSPPSDGLPIRVEAPHSVTFPSELAPAIWPYLNCLYDSHGIERRAQDGSVQAPTVAAGTDCQAQRREAATHADRILRNRSMGTTAQRHAYAEAVLSRVDRYVESLGYASPRPAAVASADKPADPLPSIDIPYQILPAFQVYTGCFADHFNADPRSHSADAAQLRQANIDAVGACRDVRAAQLARALQLLTDYRLYGGSRAVAEHAARSAFDRFDHDYLIDTSERSTIARAPSETNSNAENR